MSIRGQSRILSINGIWCSIVDNMKNKSSLPFHYVVNSILLTGFFSEEKWPSKNHSGTSWKEIVVLYALLPIAGEVKEGWFPNVDRRPKPHYFNLSSFDDQLL